MGLGGLELSERVEWIEGVRLSGVEMGWGQVGRWGGLGLGGPG